MSYVQAYQDYGKRGPIWLILKNRSGKTHVKLWSPAVMPLGIVTRHTVTQRSAVQASRAHVEGAWIWRC